jgi:hypothetical protein
MSDLEARAARRHGPGLARDRITIDDPAAQARLQSLASLD